MSTVVPPIPTFASNDSSQTNLDNLSRSVRFLTGDLRPQWHGFKTSNSATLTSQTWTTIGFANVAYDSEESGAGLTGAGILTTLGTGVATIKTQGIYAVESCMSFVATATAFQCMTSFLITGGGSNPHLSSGVTMRFGLRGDETINVAASQVCLCCADTTPITCYPGDTIAAQGWAGAATVVTFNNNSDYKYGRFSSNFTGRWIRAGV